MTPLADLPVWAALTTAVCVLIGAGLTFTGSLGLLRLGSFYERVHAPTLGATLGTGFVLIASIVCFSALESRLFRSEEHTSELQSLMRISYAVFCLKKKKNQNKHKT